MVSKYLVEAINPKLRDFAILCKMQSKVIYPLR